MKNKLIIALVLILTCFNMTLSFAESPLPQNSSAPISSANPSAPASAVPGTPTPTPVPTIAVIVTASPIPETEAPTEIPAAPTPVPTSAPTSAPTVDPALKEAKTLTNGKLFFWMLVALVAGIWIGIGIGAAKWRRKTIFMTQEERKIIGRK